VISDLVSSHLLLNVFIHNTQKKERERDERTRYKIHSGTTTTTTNIIIIYIVVYLYFLPPGLQMDHFLVRERHDVFSSFLFFLMNFEEVVFVLLFFKFLFCFSCWFFFCFEKSVFFSLSSLSSLSFSRLLFCTSRGFFVVCFFHQRDERDREREREKKRGEKILVSLFLSLALQRETLFFEQSRHTTQQL